MFNKKGFTLIELLAVIVILGIVMVVTIPSVISSVSNARMKSFQNAADALADWFQKQYDLAVINAADSAYDNWLENNGCSEMAEGIYGEDIYIDPVSYNCGRLTSEVISAAGISKSEDNIDVDSSFVYFNQYKNMICVRLYNDVDGEFATGGKISIHADSPGCNVDECYNIFEAQGYCYD